MDNEKTRHMTKIILDDLKDAEMSLGYAKEAHAAGDDATAAVFRDEAHNRLGHAKEWYDKMKREAPGDMDSGAYHAMKCHLKEWYHDMVGRVDRMHE
jgi:rubrerythrin